MKFFTSKYFKVTDPLDTFYFFNDVIPIHEFKVAGYEHFRFEGWDKLLDKVEQDSDSVEAQKSSNDTGGLALPSFDDPDYSSKLEQAANIHRLRSQKIIDDLDSLVKIGIEKAQESLSNFKETPFKTSLLRPLEQIPHVYLDEEEIPINTTFWFLEWEKKYFNSSDEYEDEDEDEDEDDFSFVLPSGRIANVLNLNGAMLLFALEKATAAALRNEVWATSKLLLSAAQIHLLSERLNNSEYEYVTKSRAAKSRAKSRHKKTYAIKNFAIEMANNVIKNYPTISTLQIATRILPEVEKFAEQQEQPLTERGAKTVYDWLLAHRKSPSALQT